MNVDRFVDSAPELLERLLHTGAAYGDVFYEHTLVHRHERRQRLLGRRLGPPRRRRHTHELHGTGLRALAGREQGFAAADGWEAPRLRTTADRAAVTLDATGPARRPAPLSSTSSLAWPDARQPLVAAPLLDAAADAAFALDEAVRHVRVVCQERSRRVAVATSEGVLAAWAQPLVALRVEVVFDGPSGETTTHEVMGGTTAPDVWNAERAAREAVRRARMLAVARPLPGGRLPVVLAPGWGGVWLHEAVGHLLEADVVDDGPFADSLGRQVAARGVTLVDDGTLAAGRATAPCDDEGTPTCRTTLIDDGTLAGLLTDRRHRPHDAPLSGNARRQDYRHPPLPRMTNLCLLPATTAPDDLIETIDAGLYVEMLGGGYVWPHRRAFAFDVLAGRRIERGRLTHPTAPVRVSGQVPDALHSITLGYDTRHDDARGVCSKCGQAVPVSVSMPSVRLDGLNVAAC